MSLRTRILLLVLLATAAPAVVFGVAFLNERNRDIADDKRHLGALAAYAVENLNDKIKGTIQLLHGLSRVPDIDVADKAACSVFLAGVLGSYPQYTGLLTITPDGDLHCDSLRSGRALNVSGRAYFKQARASAKPAFDVVFGGLTGIAVLQVAYPVLDRHGVLKYVLLASLNLTRYMEDFVAVSHFPEMAGEVWNRNGDLMVHKPDGTLAGLVGRNFAGSELFRFAASGESGVATSLPGVSGVRRLWARGALPEPGGGGARIVLGVPEDVLVAEADRRLRNALVLLLGVSALAFAGAWFVAETGIRRHLRRMASVATRVGAGDLGARIGPPYPRGELGDLMAIVDRTGVAVEAQQAQIASTSLELQKVNRTLRVISGINSVIVRAQGREELFREACRIAVEDGGFRMSFIATADRSTGRIVPSAFAGKDEGLQSDIREILSSSTQASTTMVARAIRERKAVVSNDSQSDSQVVFGGRYADAGVRSMAVLPLMVSDDAVGVLALYSTEDDFFDQAEMHLLTELAGDIAFAIDYSEKKEKLDYLAYYDALTGLANRNLFIERVTQHLRGAASGDHKLALILIDLERFKNINDSLGRAAGDELLRQIAAWLTRNLGGADLLARVGADHFAAVIPRVRKDGDLRRVSANLAQAFLDHPFRVNDAVFRISAKAGIAVFPDDGADATTLFKNAEAALKKAKEGGERYLFYSREMTATVAARLILENQLREALDKDEFVLHYQPRVHLESGKLTGAEALIRWNDPSTGMVPPGRFIPVLEETGLIQEVGLWALRKAIEDYLRWRAAGLPAVRVAVNVSAMQLRSRDFVDDIRQAVSVDLHAASGLELEFTESLIMEDVERNIASLTAIRDLGITIAIDDFGTGYSSLNHLAKLPVDSIKIDRSFVDQMTLTPQGLSLVSTIITLAHSLKMTVVAEGVETEEQSRLLRLLRCEEIQGFLFSAPVSAELFESGFLQTQAERLP